MTIAKAVRNSLLFVLPISAALGEYALSVNIGIQLYLFRLFVLVAVPSLILLNVGRVRLQRAEWAYVLGLYVWILWGLASLWWAPDALSALNEVMTVAFGGAAALSVLVASLDGEANIDWLRRGWVGAFLATGAVALWELRTHHHLQSSYATAAGDSADGIVIATFGNPNNYGAFLVLAFPYLVWSLLEAKRLWRVLYAVLCAAIPVLIILTAGRLSLVGLVVEGAVLCELFRRRGRSLIWIVPVALVGAVGLVAAVQANPRTAQKILSLGTELSKNGSVSSRVNITLDAAQFTVESYGFGTGAGSFENLMLAGRGNFPTQHIINPHNYWMEVLSQYGIVVFLFMCAAISLIGWQVVRASRVACLLPPGSFLRLAVVAMGLAGYAFASVENSRFIPQPVNWVFWGSVLAALRASDVGASGTRNREAYAE